MSASLARALGRDAEARKNWDRLTPSRQKELLRYLAGLQSDAARSRNIARAMAVLHGARRRFLGRAWKDGR